MSKPRQPEAEPIKDQRTEQLAIDELNRKIEILTALVGPDSRPNITALTDATRHLTSLAMNVKFFGYEIARSLAAALPVRTGLLPQLTSLGCKPSTQADLESDWVAYWSSQLKIPVVFHRKLWEYCYVLQAFHNVGALSPGKRGIGFGCGVEPLPSLMASYGVSVVVTDLSPDDQVKKAWAAHNQQAKVLSDAYKPELVSKEAFDANVSFEYIDMNDIPATIRGFDFCWSICALEHLGSIENGIRFIEAAMDVLDPGGVAVHTTEYNFSRADINFDNWDPVTFQKKHFEEIAARLKSKGYKVAPLDFNFGDKVLDKFIDIPPFPYHLTDDVLKVWHSGYDHIKVSMDGIPVTCFGLIITK